MDQSNQNQTSLLTNLRSHHVVKVFNPLSRDFTGQVARSVSEVDTRYVDKTIESLRLRNDSHPVMKHVTQTITLPQGKSMNLPGDVAQVIVYQLVNEIMGLRGHKATISDPDLRRGVEEEVILNTEDLRMQVSTLNIEDQLNKQIENLNRESISNERVAENEPDTAEVASQPEVFGGQAQAEGNESDTSRGSTTTTESSGSAQAKPTNSKK
jgi:hypothetical protein